jgi:hypothetical protein
MGTKKGRPPFEVTLRNMPLLDLREEFREYLALLEDKGFESLFGETWQPIETQFCTWYGDRDALVTLMLQRAILGIEAYLPAAVLFEAGLRGRIDVQNDASLNNPFSLGGSGTADNYYNLLPAKLESRLALKQCNPKLWKRTRQFYQEVRNPLFHGYEIECEEGKFSAIVASFRHIAKLYSWIDSWHSLEAALEKIIEDIEKKKSTGDV